MQRSTFFTMPQLLLLGALKITQSQAEAAPLDYLKRIKDGTLLIKTDVITGGTGTVQLIDSNTRVVVGVSTFNSTQLRAGQQFLLSAIRIAFAEVASTVTTGPAMQVYSNKLADCPLPLQGANLVSRQGGVVQIDIPIKRLLSNGTVEKNVGEDGYPLDTPKWLQPELETVIEIRYPDQAASVTYTASKKQFVELMLIGPEAAV